MLYICRFLRIQIHRITEEIQSEKKIARQRFDTNSSKNGFE